MSRAVPDSASRDLPAAETAGGTDPVPRLVAVARLARVSPATVSRVASGRGAVSAATRLRVQKVIDLCGYQPDPLASGLRRKRATYVLVLRVAGETARQSTQREREFEVIEQLVDAVSRHGSLVLFRRVAHLDRERLRCLAEECGARSAVLVGSASDLSWDALAGALPQLEVVEIDADGIGIHDVPLQEQAGARTVVRHLLEAGCRDVAYLGDARHPFGSARYQGFRDACGRSGRCNHVLQFDPACGLSLAESLESLLTGWQRADGLFAATDALGIRAIAALRELGRDVPGEVRVAAMGGTLAAARCEPPLTSLAPATEAGLDALAQRLCGAPAAARAPGEAPAGSLIIRASSQPER